MPGPGQHSGTQTRRRHPITGGLLLAKIFEEAGLPAGLLQVVTHSHEDAATVGDAMTEDEIPRVISFTGSTKSD